MEKGERAKVATAARRGVFLPEAPSRASLQGPPRSSKSAKATMDTDTSDFTESHVQLGRNSPSLLDPYYQPTPTPLIGFASSIGRFAAGNALFSDATLFPFWLGLPFRQPV